MLYILMMIHHVVAVHSFFIKIESYFSGDKTKFFKKAIRVFVWYQYI